MRSSAIEDDSSDTSSSSDDQAWGDCDSERIEILQKFLKAGADVNKRDLDGNTGLMYCLTTNSMSRDISDLEIIAYGENLGDEVIAIVRCLLLAGADANVPDISGRRPLEIVVDLSKDWDEVKILELTETLINHGAKYNDYEKGSDSLVHMAVDNGLEEVVDFLVRKGADINHQGKTQQTPLHRYILKARKSEFLFLLRRRPASHQTIMDILLSMTDDPNVEDENGDSPLNLVSHLNRDDFRKILKAGADPLHKGKENVNAYEKCIKSGELELLEILLQEKSSTYITDTLFSDFWSLPRRCNEELYQRVMLLMLSTNKDIDLNRENSLGDTPLTFFCRRNATEVISKLLERGADINLTTTTGLSALHSVFDLSDGPEKNSTIAVLMSSNPDMDVKDTSGRTVLQKAIKKYLDRYSYRDRRSKCVCKFIEHSLNAGATCDQSDLNSVLQSAVEQHNFSLMAAVVKRGADLFHKIRGKGVLHRCWSMSFYSQDDLSSMLEECIEYIKTHKQQGGCLDEVDDNGNTPLLAYMKSDMYTKGKTCEDLSDEVVALLAPSKDVVCKADVQNVFPLHMTASRGRLNSMKILVKKGADLFSKNNSRESCLHNCLSSEKGHQVDMVRYILENGVSPNDANKYHETPLYLIIRNAKYHSEDDVSAILKLLIKHGANPNLETFDKNPLVTAIRTFNVGSTEILLKNGANLNELCEGPTALHVLYKCFSHSYQTTSDRIEKIKKLQHLLLRKEISLNAKDKEGKTVLHVAVEALCNVSTTKHLEAVRLIQELVKHRSDVNATDKKDRSALSICCESDRKDCAKLGKYLLKVGADPRDGCALNLALKLVRKAELTTEWKAFILQLIANGANTNAKSDSSSIPSLIRAIDAEDVDIVKALLEHGADLNASDYTGTTLIHACRLKNEDAKQIISLLLQYGCRLNLKETEVFEYKDRRYPLLAIVKRMIEDDSYIRISRKSGKMTGRVDLTLFNMFVCGGSELMVPTRERYTGNSVLAKLTKAGYFKAAESLVRCGYNFKEDAEFKNIDFSKVDAPAVRSEGKRYKRVDHENAKTEFQEMIKNCEEETFSLASLCRRTVRQHLIAVHDGSEIETKITSLPLPTKVIQYLNYREYTQEYEEFELDDDRQSEIRGVSVAEMLAYMSILNNPMYPRFSIYDDDDFFSYSYDDFYYDSSD